MASVCVYTHTRSKLIRQLYHHSLTYSELYLNVNVIPVFQLNRFEVGIRYHTAEYSAAMDANEHAILQGSPSGIC